MTPDLQTRIRSSELTRERAKQISEASKSLTAGFRVWNAWELGGFFRRTPFLEIPELHEYLTDAADWDAATWDFEPEGCERLGRTLAWLYGELPEAFEFSATWGPVSIDEVDIGRTGLLAVAERNQVATASIYRVHQAGSG